MKKMNDNLKPVVETLEFNLKAINNTIMLNTREIQKSARALTIDYDPKLYDSISIMCNSTVALLKERLGFMFVLECLKNSEGLEFENVNLLEEVEKDESE